jgi:hypothetical protein
MSGEEFGEPRNDLARAVDHRKRKPDQAAQRIAAARRILGVFQTCKNFACTLKKQRARVGRRNAPRGAEEERDAKAFLKVADDAGDRWLRQPEFPRGARKAAALRGANEDGQLLQPVCR